ncbi:adenine nucleotide alpha hydrolases-like protein [Eremomyces bilateralis CBS 781.70]|uniref:Adenine nucleotide alpha hydrolases-like protein n=1 Tax=Eremomyces bilateralis CBS 781.70 TaxID=1392243 RepID=A0A6G1G216_9PEZI|nr:adenine nucleotide alpha hydrolases-like protein [Eremomyces bilateralis CBS 781.70]KAF1812155.1 adenine nucleotide alpha hydrolases-like protein [Eremomyces bilateralis CBS 781.70]
MSLENALDEERLEILALLEGRPTNSAPPTNRERASSPSVTKSPVRSMLDIGPPPPQPRSMLDVGPAPSTRRIHSSLAGSAVNPEEAYKFEMLPSIEAHALPKRVTQGGKKAKGAMSSVFGSGDSSSRAGSRSGPLTGHKKSKSPGTRSQSPANRNLHLMPDPGKYYSESGKAIDMSSAYRRLSDAALLRHGGTFASLPHRKGSDPETGEFIGADGHVRLEMDYDPDEKDEEALEISDDSSDEDVAGKKRGRRRTREGSTGSVGGLEAKARTLNIDGGKRPPTSLMGAAEEERKETAYKYRSLLDDPSISITEPEDSLEYITQANKRPGVHPATNFDAHSALSTPMTSDDEGDLDDIRRAQKLELTASQVKSTPENQRCVREIIRGEYITLQEEAQQGLRRQRVYLVATDLSDEAEYALEWTIGTVLRDGDTLLAVYAMDEEAIGATTDASHEKTEGNGSSDPTSLLRTLSNDAAGPTGLIHGTHPLTAANLSPLATVTNADGTKTMDKAERERWHAVMEVSDRCIKLIRGTRLQARILVEVFHCKNPKHMITEVIDYLEPTLVVLGSRGRSALKGVLLGSFSNYLVTKSSVPVMVARKKLRKHPKYKRTNTRFSNVLSSPSGKLASAKID